MCQSVFLWHSSLLECCRIGRAVIVRPPKSSPFIVSLLPSRRSPYPCIAFRWWIVSINDITADGDFPPPALLVPSGRGHRRLMILRWSYWNQSFVSLYRLPAILFGKVCHRWFRPTVGLLERDVKRIILQRLTFQTGTSATYQYKKASTFSPKCTWTGACIQYIHIGLDQLSTTLTSSLWI